jgi:hypothetical protein
MAVWRKCDDQVWPQPGSSTKETQQLGIDFLCVGPSNAMEASFNDNQASPFDQFGRALSRCRNWNNAVFVPVND